MSLLKAIAGALFPKKSFGYLMLRNGLRDNGFAEGVVPENGLRVIASHEWLLSRFAARLTGQSRFDCYVEALELDINIIVAAIEGQIPEFLDDPQGLGEHPVLVVLRFYEVIAPRSAGNNAAPTDS